MLENLVLGRKQASKNLILYLLKMSRRSIR